MKPKRTESQGVIRTASRTGLPDPVENFDICPYCGASNPPGARRCENCGEEIEEGDQELY